MICPCTTKMRRVSFIALGVSHVHILYIHCILYAVYVCVRCIHVHVHIHVGHVTKCRGPCTCTCICICRWQCDMYMAHIMYMYTYGKRKSAWSKGSYYGTVIMITAPVPSQRSCIWDGYKLPVIMQKGKQESSNVGRNGNTHTQTYNEHCTCRPPKGLGLIAKC